MSRLLARKSATAGPHAPAASAYGPRLMTPLLLGSVLNPVNSTMIATGLVAIGHDFGVGASSTAWLVASLYLASAVAQPTMGRLADLLGPRRIFVSGLLVVLAAGLTGALAPGFGWLIASRVLLGVGTSAAYPAAMAMLRAVSRRTGQEAPRTVLGLLSLAGLGSMAIGPVLGGLLTATTGWRGIFAMNVPLAALGLVLALLWLPKDAREHGTQDAAAARAARDGGETAKASLDGLGIVLFGATLTTAMLFLMDLEHPRWPLLPLVAVLAAVLTWWQLRRRAPFIDLRMLAHNRALSFTYLRHGLAYLVIYCVMYGYTQWLEEAHGYSSFHTGLIILPMSLAAAVCSVLGARTKGIRAPLTLAAVVLTAGSALLFVADHTTPLAALLLAGALFGLPQGLTSTGNQAAVFVQAPADSVGAAAGLQRTAQYLGAVTSASLIGLFYGRRATDAGLHDIAVVSGGLGLLLIVLTVGDRALRARRQSS